MCVPPRSSPGGNWSADALLPLVQAIVSTGAPDEQRARYRVVEKLARSRGLGEVVDGWEPDVAYLRGSRER